MNDKKSEPPPLNIKAGQVVNVLRIVPVVVPPPAPPKKPQK